jgi:hypothetical protein
MQLRLSTFLMTLCCGACVTLMHKDSALHGFGCCHHRWPTVIRLGVPEERHVQCSSPFTGGVGAVENAQGVV